MAGKRAEVRRKLFLHLSLNAAGKHGSRAFGTDRDRHGIAVNNRRRDEIGCFQIIDRVDENASFSRNRPDVFVTRVIACRGIDNPRIQNIASTKRAREKGKASFIRPADDNVIGLDADNHDIGFRLQEQPELCNRDLTGAHDNNALAGKIEKDREMAHASRLRDTDGQAIKRIRPYNLAGETRRVRRVRDLIELIEFLIPRWMETFDPFGRNLDVARPAGAGAAAKPLDPHLIVAQDLHQPPALKGFQP